MVRIFVNLLLAAIAIAVFLAIPSEGRALQQYGYVVYDNCYNGWQGWRDRGCYNDYWCNNYRWNCDGGYYDGNRWWGAGDRGGFCVGLCGK